MSLRPGIYQHYKGGRYRLLFTAHTSEVFLTHGDLLVAYVGPDGRIFLGTRSLIALGHTQLFVVRNSSDKPMTGACVVYVSMKHGTINARGDDEFKEKVGDLPRFWLVAE
jgi:hypothetical protein